MPHFEQVKLT
ncbi:hypothetical protein D043_5269A, partial [Vibrio parahaemolyticus EKP-021]